jgi:hypothetical protein
MDRGGCRGGLAVRLGAAALASLTLLACNPSADQVDSVPPATPLPTPAPDASDAAAVPAPPSTSREADVVAAYRAHWAAWYQAAQAADPELPAIAATTTGSFLERTRQEIGAMRSSGERVRGDAGVPPIDSKTARVVRFESDASAVLVDCYVDNTVRYDAAGKPVGSTDPTFFAATATIVRVDDAWKVASLQLKKDGCRV